ncbi:MAG: glycosyltransferase family 4 protein [Thermodesulfobacteriota bacterium]
MPSDQRLHVLHLGSPANMYGAERWIIALVRHLDPARVRSIVAAVKDAPDQDAPLCTTASELGLETALFEAPGRLNWSAVRQLRRYIHDHDIHILHTHFYKTDLLGFLATRGTACRIVSTPHGWSTEVDFKLRCYEELDRLLLPLLDAVAPLSLDLHTALAASWYRRLWNCLRRGPGRLTLIRNGVDIAEVEEVHCFAPGIQTAQPAPVFTIGYIGQLIPRKGLATLLQAFAYLPSTLPWQAVLIGDGPERAELEDLARTLGLTQRVRFVGFQTNRLEFLKTFDVFVLPSTLEGIPRCLMEAMAAGVPVIASDIPGCSDLIVHDSTGLLFAKGKAEELAAFLTVLAQQPERRQGLAARARKVVQERFSAERMALDYTALYYSLMRQGHPKFRTGPRRSVAVHGGEEGVTGEQESGHSPP